jgi:hypothetical protein
MRTRTRANGSPSGERRVNLIAADVTNRRGHCPSPSGRGSQAPASWKNWADGIRQLKQPTGKPGRYAKLPAVSTHLSFCRFAARRLAAGGRDVPLLVNLQPAGEYLGEDYYRAGGVPAVAAELLKQGLIMEEAITVTGPKFAAGIRRATIEDDRVIRRFDAPRKEAAGFSILLMS